MRLEWIKAQNFRNYRSLQAGDFRRTNVLVGANGSGKTNFLEAVYLLSTAIPIRSVNHSDLILWGAKYYYINGSFDGHTVALGYSESKKALKFDENPVRKAELKVRNPVVAFQPDDIDVISGSPDTKRAFLDSFLSMASIEYAYALARYQKTLRQRNAQLKIAPKDAHIWNKELASNGEVLVKSRIEFIRYLNAVTKTIFCELYDRDIELQYLNNFKIQGSVENSILEALESSIKVDTIKKFTSKGPHRDAYEAYVAEGTERKIASGAFASQGQLRSLSLSVKLGATGFIEAVSGNSPVLLLDDVLLEMDSERRQKFLGFVSGKYQTFLTATSAGIFKNLPSDAYLKRIDKGEIKDL